MITLKINGESQSLEVPLDMPLLWVLRDVLGMTGTKFGCGIAQCGACTVHIDGKPVRSCLLPVGAIGDRSITTIEGIGATPAGAKVQKAWLDLEVIQCGYCQSGQIMSAAALARQHAASRRCRHRRCDGRQYLPLRDLYPHPRRDQARRRRRRCLGARQCIRFKHVPRSSSRRAVLRGGLAGVLVVGFTSSGARRQRAGTATEYGRQVYA